MGTRNDVEPIDLTRLGPIDLIEFDDNEIKFDEREEEHPLTEVIVPGKKKVEFGNITKIEGYKDEFESETVKVSMVSNLESEYTRRGIKYESRTVPKIVKMFDDCSWFDSYQCGPFFGDAFPKSNDDYNNAPTVFFFGSPRVLQSKEPLVLYIQSRIQEENNKRNSGKAVDREEPPSSGEDGVSRMKKNRKKPTKQQETVVMKSNSGSIKNEPERSKPRADQESGGVKNVLDAEGVDASRTLSGSRDPQGDRFSSYLSISSSSSSDISGKVNLPEERPEASLSHIQKPISSSPRSRQNQSSSREQDEQDRLAHVLECERFAKYLEESSETSPLVESEQDTPVLLREERPEDFESIMKNDDDELLLLAKPSLITSQLANDKYSAKVDDIGDASFIKEHLPSEWTEDVLPHPRKTSGGGDERYVSRYRSFGEGRHVAPTTLRPRWGHTEDDRDCLPTNNATARWGFGGKSVSGESVGSLPNVRTNDIGRVDYPPQRNLPFNSGISTSRRRERHSYSLGGPEATRKASSRTLDHKKCNVFDNEVIDLTNDFGVGESDADFSFASIRETNK